MVKITCFKCHWSWSLSSEEVKTIFDALTPEDNYYAVGCPKCRRVNKVTRKQLQQALPRPAAEPDTPESEVDEAAPPEQNSEEAAPEQES
ncbi:MAG: hypothetical protein JXB07_15080 [Anaerolineae bacterium]|nr:hypothetical protein [Anaerolineae bacterium]